MHQAMLTISCMNKINDINTLSIQRYVQCTEILRYRFYLMVNTLQCTLN